MDIPLDSIFTPLRTGSSAVPKCIRTFVATDIEGSTSKWSHFPDAMRVVMDQHNAMLIRENESFGGQRLSEAGDGFLFAFMESIPALRFAKALQHKIAEAEWPSSVGPIRVRISLHRGEVELLASGEYRGITLNRNARILAAAHGGQVVCSTSVATTQRADVEFTEIGVFRLRNIPAPERLFQVCWPGMPCREFPPLSAAPAFVHNLPPSRTRFFGRVKEIATVREMLISHPSDPSSGALRSGSLTTLTGPGGTGKTRLSIAVGESVLTQFSHAVWFVALDDVHDPTMIGTTMRDAMRIKPEATADAFEQVCTFLKPEPAVIIFDNFEQLGQEGAEFIQTLTARLPLLRCVITSRERLRLPGEREISVPTLSAPRGGEPVEQLLEFESVQLYLDRAQAVRSDFCITVKNAPAVAELCARLEGIPLAIELAAAKASVVTPQEAVKALNQRLDFFSNDVKSAPSRHRTLRAAIDWSYDFLPPALRAFFANLSIFRGGCDAEAAEAIAAPPGLVGVSSNALRALGELRGASLLIADEVNGVMRFRMLETLRQYAEERLEASADAASVAARHREHFLCVAQASEVELQKDGQEDCLARLEAEHDNFRAALTRFSSAPATLELAALLVRFWMIRGYRSEGRLWLNKLRADVIGATERSLAAAANSAGILRWTSGDLVAARGDFEEALHYFRQHGIFENVAGILSNIAIVANATGDADAARHLGAESVAMYRALPHAEQAKHSAQFSQALCNLGAIALHQNDLASAHETLAESVKVARQAGDHFAVATALYNVGHAWLRQDDVAKARPALQESFAIRCRLKDRGNAASALSTQAALATKEGRMKDAARFLAASRIARERYDTFLNETDAATNETAWATLHASLSDAEVDQTLRQASELLDATFGSEESLSKINY